ncbi:MAG: sigma-70 family RNA polymerase sigma factor [Acidobacteriota bacterium]
MQQETSEVPTVLRKDGTAGGAPVFEEAYLLYAPRLRRIAYRKYGIPIADSETLVQDVFTSFFTHAEEVNDVWPYLVGAICNAARNHLKRADRTDALFCAGEPCPAIARDDVGREVEVRLLLDGVLARVGSRCRELFQRYYVNGETTRMIADALHTTPGTVLLRLHQCRKRAVAAHRSMSENA